MITRKTIYAFVSQLLSNNETDTDDQFVAYISYNGRIWKDEKDFPPGVQERLEMQNNPHIYNFKIRENATYVQTGNIVVQAKSHEEAVELAVNGKYDHLGDNKIDYDEEKVLSRTVIDPENDKEWATKDFSQKGSELESLADIAHTAGAMGYYGGDSRQDMQDFITWSKEFESKWEGHQWGIDEGPDYIDAIDAFCEEKMNPQRVVIETLSVEVLNDENPDLSYLDQWERSENQQERQYHKQNQKRKAEYGDTWHCMGIRAKAEIKLPRQVQGQNGMETVYRLQTVTSGGLWGVESDSGDIHLNSIAREEFEELKNDLEQLKVNLSSWDAKVKEAMKEVVWS